MCEPLIPATRLAFCTAAAKLLQ